MPMICNAQHSFRPLQLGILHPASFNNLCHHAKRKKHIIPLSRRRASDHLSSSKIRDEADLGHLQQPFLFCVFHANIKRFARECAFLQ